MPRRRHLLKQFVPNFTLLAIGLVMCVTARAGATLQAQRTAFKAAYAAASQGNDDWRTLASGLESYPLYPWLAAAALEHDLKQATPAQVRHYLDRYPDLLPARDLRRDFLHELARRKDWTAYLSLYHDGMGHDLACYALQARLAKGETLHWDDLAGLWTDPSLPASCTPVQKWAHAHGLLTPARLWARIDRAADTGHGGTVAWLSRWLEGTDQVQARHLAKALRDPLAAARAATQWPDNPRNRHAATLAMVAVARRDSDHADQLWPALHAHFHFTTAQVRRIRADMALYVATDFSADALHRLATLPAAAQTDATRAWRVRVALARKDWQAALQALDALTPEQRDQGEWRYLRARVLAELGRKNAADALYASLARSATYYGFLSADRAHLPYAICTRELSIDPTQLQGLLKRPRLDRAFELFAVGLLPDARRVWRLAVANLDPGARQAAAWLAWQRGWYDRAIRTFSHGALKQLYAQRFPVPRHDGVTEQAEQAGVDPAWAYAIIRAESAWMPDARSRADARGLMQLLPSTARLVARRQDIAYHGDLYDPHVNVALGTRYLAHVAARFDGAPYLATAAYNAGPVRVDEWLAARGDLPPDLFVATIPYRETRAYVMRVMAYSVIYDWRLHGNAVSLAARMPREGQVYTPPNAATPRKAVVCPTSTGTATETATASGGTDTPSG